MAEAEGVQGERQRDHRNLEANSTNNKEVNKNTIDVSKERRDALEFIELYSIRVDDTKLKLIKCQRKVQSCLKNCMGRSICILSSGCYPFTVAERAEYIPYHNNVPLQSAVGLCNNPAHSQTKLAEGALYGKCKTITSEKRLPPCIFLLLLLLFM